MILQLYHRFFDKNKPLRHPVQHILVGAVGFCILQYFFPEIKNGVCILSYCVATFVIDLDGLFSIIATFHHTPEAKEILHEFMHGNLEKTALLATCYHKKFNRLFVHNIFGFLMITLLFIVAVNNRNFIVISVTGAILAHFLFDIWDDYYQLGHLHNWLWPTEWK
jgi:hypothetical protein